MKISYSIMAHPRRKEWAEDLSNKLNCPIYFDTDNTIWNTCKGAWDLHDKEADYHFVIQDDAILCDDFKEKVHELVTSFDEEVAFQLYIGRDRLLEKGKEYPEGYIKHNVLMWGVAIGLPVKHIEDMKRFGDGYYAWQDDTKIKYFLKSKNIPVVFPVPCFVDHRKEANTLTPCVDYNKQSPIFIENQKEKPKIPKVIHQIWIGDPELMPSELMDTWKMKGWEYQLWTEKEIDAFGLENRELYDYFYNKKCYYGASDVVRAEVIARLGGVYIDADTERFQSIDEIMEDCTFWSVWSNKEGRVANGVIASIPKHPIVVNYKLEMGKAKQVEPVWSTIGGTLFTEMIFKYKDEDIKLLPPVAFYPYDSKGIKNTRRTKNYARHYWKSTHRTYGN